MQLEVGAILEGKLQVLQNLALLWNLVKVKQVWYIFQK